MPKKEDVESIRDAVTFINEHWATREGKDIVRGLQRVIDAGPKFSCRCVNAASYMERLPRMMEDYLAGKGVGFPREDMPEEVWLSIDGFLECFEATQEWEDDVQQREQVMNLKALRDEIKECKCITREHIRKFEDNVPSLSCP
jgi:hypothetical protein